MQPDPAAPFLTALGTDEQRTCWAALPDLADVLLGLWERASQPWPKIRLDLAVYLAYLAARWPAQEPPDRNTAALNLSDLYLACAYLGRVSGAAKALEDSYLAHVPNMIASINLTQAQRESVVDAVREKVLVGRVQAGTAPSLGHEEPPVPGLASYSGRGALLEWLRVVAVSTALKLVDRAEYRFRADEEAALRQLGESPELAYIKGLDKPTLVAAIKHGFAALDQDQRTLLRLYYIDGLNLEEIAETIKVDSSTVSRRLKTARARVAEATRRTLRDTLHLDEKEAESLLRLIQSRLDLGLSGALRP